MLFLGVLAGLAPIVCTCHDVTTCGSSLECWLSFCGLSWGQSTCQWYPPQSLNALWLAVGAAVSQLRAVLMCGMIMASASATDATATTASAAEAAGDVFELLASIGELPFEQGKSSLTGRRGADMCGELLQRLGVHNELDSVLTSTAPLRA